MTHSSGRSPKTLVLVLVILAAALLTVGLCKNLLLVQIDNPEVLAPVSEGDVLVHTYMHSMYQVPVSEKFKIERGHFRLFHVKTDSYAALEYLGLERKDEPNVDVAFAEFSIPAASIGKHMLRLHDREIPLGTHQDSNGRIRVKLVQASAVVYFARLLWR
ncbi:MAG: hypothetical protein AB1473_20540 [Thermodesulfobacteriota bacterium]